MLFLCKKHVVQKVQSFHAPTIQAQWTMPAEGHDRDFKQSTYKKICQASWWSNYHFQVFDGKGCGAKNQNVTLRIQFFGRMHIVLECHYHCYTQTDKQLSQIALGMLLRCFYQALHVTYIRLILKLHGVQKATPAWYRHNANVLSVIRTCSIFALLPARICKSHTCALARTHARSDAHKLSVHGSVTEVIFCFDILMPPV